MKRIICLLTGLFLIFACSAKTTKTELINELEAENFCKGIACEKGVIIKENLNRIVHGCFEKSLESMPNEITKEHVNKITPELGRCIKYEVEFTPTISKDKMLVAIMDGDISERFSHFKSNQSRLELNKRVGQCYQESLEKMPPIITMNQFKIVELKVEKCMFDKSQDLQ